MYIWIHELELLAMIAWIRVSLRHGKLLHALCKLYITASQWIKCNHTHIQSQIVRTSACSYYQKWVETSLFILKIMLKQSSDWLLLFHQRNHCIFLTAWAIPYGKPYNKTERGVGSWTTSFLYLLGDTWHPCHCTRPEYTGQAEAKTKHSECR